MEKTIEDLMKELEEQKKINGDLADKIKESNAEIEKLKKEKSVEIEEDNDDFLGGIINDNKTN